VGQIESKPGSTPTFTFIDVGVLDTGVSRSTCSWAPSSAHLQPRGEPTTKAIQEDPHEEARHEENDGGNC
jgi:hypothetical protein